MQKILDSLLTNGHWWPATAELPTMPSTLSSLDDRFNSLSRQELRILLYIKEGRLNKQIADDLDIRESTVKTHITALLRKLNLRSRTQAAVLAQRQIGRAHVCTPVTNAQLVCRLLLEKKKNLINKRNTRLQ